MVSKELWAFFFVLGALLFNWPLLSIFDLSMPYYLFGMWGVFIIFVAFFSRLQKKSKAS